MIITITGAESTIRLVVAEDCALSRLQYKKLVNCVNPYLDSYEITGINRYLWARILFFTNVEFFGENWAIAMHKKLCDNWTQVLQNG
jgi:hypothetical protein